MTHTRTSHDPAYEAAMRRPRAVTDLPLFGTVDAPRATVAVARATDPATSHQAAARQTAAAISHTQRRILALYPIDRAITDVQLLAAWAAAHRADRTLTPKRSDSGIRSRRADLSAFGYLVDAGTVDGHTLRRLTAKGLDARGEG